MIRLAIALLLITSPAAAAPQCGDRAAIVQSLTGTYGETRRGIGLAANNAVLEVFAADTGSWTVIITTPQGVTCLIASGQHYEVLDEALPPEGDPA